MRYVFISLMAFFSFTGFAWAWSFDAGQGCCGNTVNDLIKQQPDEVQAGALEFFNTLSALYGGRLAFLRAMDDQVCSHTDCGEMEPTFVRRLVLLASEKQQSDWVNRLTLISTVATAFSTVIAFAAFWFSFASDRRSRRIEATIGAAKVRSIEGEV